MSFESQRVVVIQDASRDVSISAIKKALKKISLKPGDELTLLAILVYKMELDSSSSFVAIDPKIPDEEVAKKKEEYDKSLQIKELSDYCKTKNSVFNIEVLTGPSPKVASDAARKFRATWLILDKEMTKDKRHFMDNLACGMYRIRNHNRVQKLRKPKSTENPKSRDKKPEHVRYMEMIPGSAEEEFSFKRPRSSSSEQLMATSISALQNNEASTSKQQQAQNPTTTKHKTAGTQSLFYIPEGKKIGQTEAPQPEMKEEFTNPVCSVCKNTRPKVISQRDYSYSELYTATQGFSQKNFLSEGGFGSVYKGQIDGMTIAVKQHKCASLQGEKEFKSEVNLLSKARHENVVMLLGSCSEGNNRLLVYEYVCNGSLDRHLSQHSRAPLSWEDRIKVASGCAKGLLYLHENNIIHRDMRPNNILITHDHQPLLGDFGLARSQNQDSIHSTDVVGTLGYMAPEYAEYGKVSTKIDAYSFGVTLLQLITGMRTTDQRLGGRSLVGWARPLLRERNYPDLIDERIMNSHDCHQLFWMVRIAEKCLSRDPHKRLNMAAVVNALNHIVEGQVCGIINRDCSPARSESFYTTSDDDGESLEDEMNKSEGESESHNRESTLSSSNMSQIILGLQIPPSPPLDITPSSRSSTNGPISSSSEQLMATSISTLQNIEASTSKQQQAQNPTMTKHQTGTHSLFYIPESKKIGQTEAPQPEMKEEFANPLCSMCKNMRPKVKSRRDYSYVELYIATEGFSQKNFLSEGGFGSVYKGQIDGMTIAVKQHKCASLQGEKEFKFEVNLLSKARHENVVMLLGSCSEGNNRLLVYEYICNDSLERHLSQHSCAPLSWEDRIKVAIGCAKGLLYLHENNIIHRDVRPNNILITHDHQPLLGDFGLARSQHRDSIHSTDVVGTLGYMAPEYAEYGNVSTKMDVYSFGVTLLELITGMRTTDQRLGGRSLVGWARPLLREKNYPDLIDERIMNSHDCHQLFWVVLIAEKCLSRDPHKRLNMAAVVNALNPIVEGQVCGITIRDSSPVRSDSFYTILDDDGESSEDEMNKSKGESESHNRESTLSSSNMSQIILGLRITPCPSLDITPSGTSSTVGKAQDQSIMDMQEQNEIKVLE